MPRVACEARAVIEMQGFARVAARSGATTFVKPYDELQPLVAMGYDESLHAAYECEHECMLHAPRGFVI